MLSIDMQNPLLQKIAENEGFETWEDYFSANQTTLLDSIVPSICKNPDCHLVSEMEPDAQEGYCEECGGQTQTSCLVIMGVI